MSGCTIRLYELADEDELQAAVVESAAEVGQWMGWCHPEYSRDDARRWILTQQELARQGLAYEFSIRSETGSFLGGCGVNQVNKANRFANLGYWVRISAMGRGVAPVAARLVADQIFRETDLIRLEIVCAIDNVRSQRVAEKIGAVREGVLRSRLLVPSGPSDAVMYSLVRGPMKEPANKRMERTRKPRRSS
jgi:RimJ/RimL family protein N-acetyltransferase